MWFLLGAILVMVAGVALSAAFILWWSNRVAHRGITAHFRDAEFILEHHRVPPGWLRASQRRGWTEDRVRTELLERMDSLITFFERCPFFDEEETRHLLLSRLRREQEQWEEAPYSQLVGLDPNEANRSHNVHR